MRNGFELMPALLLRAPASAAGFLLAAVAIGFFGAYEGSRDFADVEANDPVRHQLAARARGAAVAAVWLAWALSGAPGWPAAVAGLLALCAGLSITLDTRLNLRRGLPLTYLGQPGPGAANTDSYLRRLSARWGYARVALGWYVARALTYAGGTALAVLLPR